MMTRLVRPFFLTGVLVLAAWVFARSPLPVVSAQTQVVGSGPNRAGLVVRFDDGRVETRCVAFEEQEIGGDELLQRAGINDIVIAPEGTVCRIDGQGCPSDNCFCQCPTPNCEYWAYYHRENGGWSYSQVGAALSIITDGSLDGWSWGQGNFREGVEPPQMEFDQVCPATAESTATPTATTQPTTATPPQASFFAASTSLTVGQCTMLSWQTSGATTVKLDGTAVTLQGSQQVCPTVTQSWTLIAVNATGQTTRQISVTVQSANSGGTATATPSATSVATATATLRPTLTATRQSAPAPLSTPPAIVTQAPQPLPAATVAPPVLPAPTVDLQGGGVPIAPTAQPPPVLTPTPEATATHFEFSLPATETPRPRRVLNPDDPTPTPILVARAGAKPSGGSAPASSAGSAASGTSSTAASNSRQGLQSRSFSPNLLPGYAAYVASVAVLLIMGWYVLRRRLVQAPTGRDE